MEEGESWHEQQDEHSSTAEHVTAATTQNHFVSWDGHVWKTDVMLQGSQHISLLNPSVKNSSFMQQVDMKATLYRHFCPLN